MAEEVGCGTQRGSEMAEQGHVGSPLACGRCGRFEGVEKVWGLCLRTKEANGLGVCVFLRRVGDPFLAVSLEFKMSTAILAGCSPSPVRFPLANVKKGEGWG